MVYRKAIRFNREYEIVRDFDMNKGLKIRLSIVVILWLLTLIDFIGFGGLGMLVISIVATPVLLFWNIARE